MVRDVRNTKKILIAEDEKPYCRALVLKFQNAGFDVIGVENGELAIEEIKKGGIDFLILDLIMPKMNGFAVLEEIKKMGSKTPTVVLSNLTQQEDKQKVMDLGAISFIEKSETTIADVVTQILALLK